ncbi:hypothetical protein IH980_03405 [Patescibacteria group bacterium]|nr:hypothetical protein [Patescibacteria group bacterium]
MLSPLSRAHNTAGSVRFRDSLHRLWQDRIGGRALRTALSLLVFLILLIGVVYWRLPPEIPLTYSRPWGVLQLVPSSFLFVVAVGSALLVMLNSILAALLFETEELLARILIWASALTVFLVDVTVLRVVLLVI